VKDLFEGDAKDAASRAHFDAVADMVRAANADVLALQEVGSALAVRALLERLEGQGGYGAPVVGTADKRGIRCALLSRCPVLDAQVHTTDALAFPPFVEGDPPPFDARIPLRRGVVHARVDGGALGAIDVFVAHFKSRRALPLRTPSGDVVPPASARARAEAELRSLVWRAAEALYVRGLVDDCLARSGEPRVAVMGDLNDVPESVTLSVLRDARGDARALHCCARHVPAERRYSVLHDGERAQIDHVLLTWNLFARVSSARFLNERLREHPQVAEGAPPLPDSDHAPFVVELA
jgi:endonuclease/exonuclease/phosphatase family metal-dependent hydrolase